jgi:hypothetical protein
MEERIRLLFATIFFLARTVRAATKSAVQEFHMIHGSIPHIGTASSKTPE